MGPLRNRSEVDGTFLSTERACALSFPVGCNPGGGKLYSNSFCAGHAVFAQNRQQGLCGQTSTGGIAASAGRGQNKGRPLLIELVCSINSGRKTSLRPCTFESGDMHVVAENR